MYVNINGKELDLGLAPAKKASKAKEGADKFHKGWLAQGWREVDFADATSKRAVEIAAAREVGKTPPEPLTRAEFVRLNKPKKLRSQPYGIEEAARTACDMANRMGWFGCAPKAVTKGAE